MPEQARKIDLSLQNSFSSSEKLKIGDFTIDPFYIPHDAANPCGFNIKCNNSQMSIATDLGHITNDIVEALDESSFILLEANYDPEILKFSRYPYYLKKRISGEYGHLSNSEAGKLVAHLSNKKLNTVMLGHLSKENNFPELAYKTVADELINKNFNSSNIHISVASRSNPSKIIKIN